MSVPLLLKPTNLGAQVTENAGAQATENCGAQATPEKQKAAVS